MKRTTILSNAPNFSGVGGPKEGTVGAGWNFNLIAIGNSIISGVGATNLAYGLVGQTAQELAEALDSKISWVACGSIGADSNKVVCRLVAEFPDMEIEGSLA